MPRWGGLLVAIVSLVLLSASCGLHKDVRYQGMRNLRLEKMDGDALRISGEALMHNPKGVKAKLLDMSCELCLEGKPMGLARHTERIRVPKRSDFVLPFECIIPWDQLLGNAWGLLVTLLEDGQVELSLEGEAKVRSMGVRHHIPIVHKEQTQLRD